MSPLELFDKLTRPKAARPRGVASLISLDRLRPGQAGIIRRLSPHSVFTPRLMELGLMPGERVEVLRAAPLGDPIELAVMDGRLAIRKKEARNIEVEPCK